MGSSAGVPAGFGRKSSLLVGALLVFCRQTVAGPTASMGSTNPDRLALREPALIWSVCALSVSFDGGGVLGFIYLVLVVSRVVLSLGQSVTSAISLFIVI